MMRSKNNNKNWQGSFPYSEDQTSKDMAEATTQKKVYTMPVISKIKISPVTISSKGCFIKESCCGLVGS
ncbi:MAG: hypothetical protein NTW94_06345 [Legionellales bacterium]|nr:hypothetical protein [Legionellales bacterium]